MNYYERNIAKVEKYFSRENKIELYRTDDSSKGHNFILENTQPGDRLFPTIWLLRDINLNSTAEDIKEVVDNGFIVKEVCNVPTQLYDNLKGGWYWNEKKGFIIESDNGKINEIIESSRVLSQKFFMLKRGEEIVWKSAK